MEILETKDYKKFENINGNRMLNQKKIQRICQDIENGFNMLPYCPVIVNQNGKKFSVIDGQHRIEVSKLTKNPVYYVICSDLTLFQIAQMNSRNEKWKMLDFLNCYIKLGIKDYEDIQYLIKKYRLAIKIAIDLLMYNATKAEHSREIFETGQFKSLYLKESKELLDLVQSIFNIYEFSSDRNLINAVQMIHKKGVINWDKLKAKIDAKPKLMDRNMNSKHYILNIERVYNDGAQNRVLLT